MSFGTAAVQRWRGGLTLLTSERVLTHNLVVGAGTIGAGGLGVAFQSLVSHQFRPADYGAVFAVVTLITLVGLPASAFTLLMAREASWSLGSGQLGMSSSLLRQGNRVLMITGLAVAVTLAIVSPWLASLLNVPFALLIAAAAGVPFSLALPLLMGELQGKQRFVTFSLFAVGQAAAKLLGAITLGFFFGAFGIIAGISLATVLFYLLAMVVLRRELSARPTKPWLRPAARYLAVAMPSTLAIALLLSADVLVVKHYFPARAAGEYAAVAALGRAIFWGASAVATVLFPKVTLRMAKGLGRSQVVNASLVLVVFGGAIGFGLLSLFSAPLLSVFAGPAYAEAAVYLPWYAVGMTLLGGVAVLTAVHQSRGRPGFLFVLVPLTVAEPIALVTFRNGLGEVVEVVDIMMALILLALATLYLREERARQPSPASTLVPQIPSPRAAGSGADI